MNLHRVSLLEKMTHAGKSCHPLANKGGDRMFRMTGPEQQATTSFLSLVDEDRIAQASARLAEMAGDISGKSFLDVGSGSGIHSLAAVRLGAARVVSFDYDAKSVACTAEMKRRFASMANWQVEAGSALDEEYLRSLGQFDVVY